VFPSTAVGRKEKRKKRWINNSSGSDWSRNRNRNGRRRRSGRSR